MGFLAALTQLSLYINHQSANLDDQINRLEKAKQEIRSEKSNAFNEWNKNLTPDLGAYWEGNRIKVFNDLRRKAHLEMQRVFHDVYDDYIHHINFKINIIEQERSVLSTARSLTYDAELLLKRGEEAAGELQVKINQIRRSLHL